MPVLLAHVTGERGQPVYATAELRDGRFFSGWVYRWDAGAAQDYLRQNEGIGKTILIVDPAKAGQRDLRWRA